MELTCKWKRHEDHCWHPQSPQDDFPPRSGWLLWWSGLSPPRPPRPEHPASQRRVCFAPKTATFTKTFFLLLFLPKRFDALIQPDGPRRSRPIFFFIKWVFSLDARAAIAASPSRLHVPLWCDTHYCSINNDKVLGSSHFRNSFKWATENFSCYLKLLQLLRKLSTNVSCQSRTCCSDEACFLS